MEKLHTWLEGVKNGVAAWENGLAGPQVVKHRVTAQPAVQYTPKQRHVPNDVHMNRQSGVIQKSQ